MKLSRVIIIAIVIGIAFIACQSAEMTSAKVYIQQENYPAALEQLKIAAGKEPTNPLVFLTMGKLFAEMDSMDQMSEAFNTALELDSTMTEDIHAWRMEKRAKYFNKGRKFGESEKWEEAIQNTETAVLIDPEFSDGWKNLAFFYEKTDQSEKALEAYRKAYELNPLDLLFAKKIAVTEFNNENKTEAERILKKLIDEGEPDVETYLLLQRVYLSQDKKEEAMEVLQVAEKEFPDDTDLLFDYGTLLFDAMGDFEGAAAYFQKIVDIDPANTDALYNLSVALYKADKFEESAACGEVLVANDPQNTLGWVQYTISLKLMGDKEKGAAAEKVAAGLDKMDKKEFDAAIKFLEPVTKQYPGWCAPWAALKVAFEEKGDADGVSKAQEGLDSCGK